MELNIAWQVWALGVCALGGAALGLFYDACRLIRGRFPLPLITPLCDAAFWLFATVLAALIVMRVLGGELRLFALVGLVCGLVLYLLTLGPLVLKVGYAVVDAALFILRKLLHPLVLLMRAVGKIFLRLEKNVKKLFSSSQKCCMINSEYPEIEGGHDDEEKARRTHRKDRRTGARRMGGSHRCAPPSRHREGE